MITRTLTFTDIPSGILKDIIDLIETVGYLNFIHPKKYEVLTALTDEDILKDENKTIDMIVVSYMIDEVLDDGFEVYLSNYIHDRQDTVSKLNNCWSLAYD